MIKFETDSRKIQKGQTFVAIKGFTVDGHNYINKAIENGATEIIAEHEVEASVPVIVVENSEKYLREQLVKLYGEKLNKLKIIGLTGTNGKTTTCYLTYQLLNMLGEKTAYMGTIGFYYNDVKITLENTTPDTLTIYKLLSEAMDAGITTVVMEVSSHSLAYDRLHGLHIDVAGFTNLTEDHLDYHKTMENYLECKLKITDLLVKDGMMIVNADDPYSNRFTERVTNYKTIGYEGDYKILDYKSTPSETKIKFSYGNKEYSVNINLTSKFNVYNYLTCLAFANSLGYSVEQIIELSDKLRAPKGRCETIKANDGYAVVDYAHTPDAVEKVITAYNALKTARVITIVGCGGDRDPLKRPIMGDIATRLSDYTILTSDNPRTEDPQKIMDDILKGVKTDNYEVILDRQEAIKKGVEMLQKDDILLVLGKGHEDYQIIGHEKHHMDDLEEIKKWIK